MGVWEWISFSLSVLVLLLLALSYAAFRVTFYATKRQKRQVADIPLSGRAKEHEAHVAAMIAEMEALTVEEIFITAEDGVRLCAHYHEQKKGAPLYIQLHGYRGSATRDFCGGNRLARMLGGNTLVIDQRAHGKSGGNVISFGIKESRDCLLWIDYAVKRFGADTPIFLTGVSMGAATVLMAAGHPLPKSVLGVIADSPYSAPADVIRRVCGQIGVPTRWGFAFLAFGGWLFGGFRIWRHSVTEAVGTATVPILIIHGEEDTLVPPEMSREVLAACASARKELVLFPEAGHGQSYIMDEERYTALARDFTEACLSAQTQP